MNHGDFKNQHPPRTEPLHAARPLDESTERITDVTEDADGTRDANIAKDTTVATHATTIKYADSAAHTKIVMHSDSATPADVE